MSEPARLSSCMNFGSGLTRFLYPCESCGICAFQKSRHHDEDAPPQDQNQEQSPPRLTEEPEGAELVQVAEKNLFQIQNVHGYVSHTHISPMKVEYTHMHTHTHVRCSGWVGLLPV